jgi:hypothetical protein
MTKLLKISIEFFRELKLYKSLKNYNITHKKFQKFSKILKILPTNYSFADLNISTILRIEFKVVIKIFRFINISILMSLIQVEYCKIKFQKFEYP